MATPERVRIGNQTAYKAIPPELPFEYAVAGGFDAFEWFPDRRPTGQGWDAADLAPEQRAAIRERAGGHGIALSVHAKLPADPLDSGSKGHLEDGVRLAEDVGATLLNIHYSRADSVARYAEAVEPWVARCAAAGLLLAIENTPADGPDEFNELFERMPVGAGMCLDIGHANLHPATRNDYLGYIDRLGPHVRSSTFTLTRITAIATPTSPRSRARPGMMRPASRGSQGGCCGADFAGPSSSSNGPTRRPCSTGPATGWRDCSAGLEAGAPARGCFRARRALGCLPRRDGPRRAARGIGDSSVRGTPACRRKGRSQQDPRRSSPRRG